MHVFIAVLGLMAILIVLLDSFQTIILPRRAANRFRLTTIFYRLTWRPWRIFAERVHGARKRETAYSYYGPISLLFLMAVWATGLVIGYGCIYYALGTPFTDPQGAQGFRTDLYFAGTTLFTLGPGDVVPTRHFVRDVVIVNAGMGLGFLAIVIGYLPVLYGAFSRREVNISLLDARAGSPPTAAELIRRHAFAGGSHALVLLLAEWERWSAELLESHISYPLLCYFRSQHDNQSWISAMTCILDTCALSIAMVQNESSRQALLTFAMARHAVADLSSIFSRPTPGVVPKSKANRLPPERMGLLQKQLTDAGYLLCTGDKSIDRLNELRAMYEGHVEILSDYMCMPLPPFVSERPIRDNWQTVQALRQAADAMLPDRSVQQPVAVGTHFEDSHSF